MFSIYFVARSFWCWFWNVKWFSFRCDRFSNNLVFSSFFFPILKKVPAKFPEHRAQGETTHGGRLPGSWWYNVCCDDLFDLFWNSITINIDTKSILRAPFFLAIEETSVNVGNKSLPRKHSLPLWWPFARAPCCSWAARSSPPRLRPPSSRSW